MLPFGVPWPNAVHLAPFALSALAACTVSPKLDGIGHLCSDGMTCPEGQTCIDFVCTADPSGTLEFVDDGADDFDEGVSTDLEWTGDRLTLMPNATGGQFVSRVFDGASSDATWTQLAWQPVARYGLPLPSQRSMESGYAEGNADMSENILLLQFDGSTSYPNGGVVTDRSGRGNNALVFGSSPLATEDGITGTALVDTFDSRLEVPAVGIADLQFGEDDFTWALWVKTNSSCVGPASNANQAYIGIEDDNDTQPKSHLWLGCFRAESTACPNAAPNGSAGGTLCSSQLVGTRDCAGYCGTSDLTDNEWHHLVLRKSGHSLAMLTMLVDGFIEAQVPAEFVSPIAFDSYDLGIGHFSVIENAAGNSDASGTLDELAIWRRALSDAEVSEIHRRGAATMSFRVRVCALADCSDAPPFVGPDGSSATSFADVGSSDGHASFELDGVVARGRYLQYQVQFDTRRAGAAPALLKARITVETD